MYPIVSVVLLLVSLALVGYPIWKAWSGEMEDDSWSNPGVVMVKGTDGAVSGEKDRLMSALSEIEFDYSMKKLSYEDYRNLKNDYAHAAVAMLEVEH